MVAAKKKKSRRWNGWAAPIKVTFNGEPTRLSKVAMQTDASHDAFRSWWRRQGAPDDIDDAFVQQFLVRLKVTKLDGKATTYNEIAARFGVSNATVANMVKAKGREMTSAMFVAAKKKREIKRLNAPAKYARATSPQERVALAKIPDAGSWEREHLMSDDPKFCQRTITGSFSGQRSDGRGCYNGRQ